MQHVPVTVIFGVAIVMAAKAKATVAVHDIDMDLPATSSVEVVNMANTAGDITADDIVYLATTCSPKIIETQECQVVTMTSEEVPEVTISESTTAGEVSSEVSVTSTSEVATSSVVEETPEPTAGATSKSGVKAALGSVGLLALGVFFML